MTNVKVHVVILFREGDDDKGFVIRIIIQNKNKDLTFILTPRFRAIITLSLYTRSLCRYNKNMSHRHIWMMKCIWMYNMKTNQIVYLFMRFLCYMVMSTRYIKEQNLMASSIRMFLSSIWKKDLMCVLSMNVIIKFWFREMLLWIQEWSCDECKC